MQSRSWVMFFVIAIVIAGAVSFLVLLYVGAFLPDARGLAFGEKVGLIEITGSIWTSSPAVDEILQFGKNDDIRAIVVRLESPGGVVAAAQERGRARDLDATAVELLAELVDASAGLDNGPAPC